MNERLDTILLIKALCGIFYREPFLLYYQQALEISKRIEREGTDEFCFRNFYEKNEKM